LTLIVVSGAPGTGKSTVARELGADLRFCVLSLDPIKEALADVLGLGDEDWSNRVGDAAAEVVFRLAAGFPTRLPKAGGAAPGGTGRCPSSPVRWRCSATVTLSWPAPARRPGAVPGGIPYIAT
jgi:hypothetical protein